MSAPTGYSGTPLAQKLGIKPGHRVKTTAAPADYANLVAPLPVGVTLALNLKPPIDIWHLFAHSRDELAAKLPECIDAIYPDGTLWVSWPKKASGVTSDLTEERIRELALPLGLVDDKVCAVDATWAGLKLVIRKELRSQGIAGAG